VKALHLHAAPKFIPPVTHSGSPTMLLAVAALVLLVAVVGGLVLRRRHRTLRAA
jgi:LPXTG-motif cell wall-anchored protein